MTHAFKGIIGRTADRYERLGFAHTGGSRQAFFAGAATMFTILQNDASPERVRLLFEELMEWGETFDLVIFDNTVVGGPFNG